MVRLQQWTKRKLPAGRKLIADELFRGKDIRRKKEAVEREEFKEGRLKIVMVKKWLTSRSANSTIANFIDK